MCFKIECDALLEYTGTDREISIPGNITQIKERAFFNSPIKKVIIHDGVTRIGMSAFDNCFLLQDVVLPSNIIEIAPWMFGNCASLENITIPNQVVRIAPCAFLKCTSLKTVVIPNNVSAIGTSAFENCSSLQNIILPSNIDTIYPWTFANCESLEDIVIPYKVNKISSWAFENCSLKTATIPDSVLDIDNKAFSGCTDLVIKCNPGSYAESWAKDQGFKTIPIMSQMRLFLKETDDVSFSTEQGSLEHNF